MKDSSTEPQTDTVDTQQRRRRRTRALLALVLIVGAFGVASRPRLNATERKLVGVWDGTEAAAGSRFRFDASRGYRIESSVGPNVLYVQEGSGGCTRVNSVCSTTAKFRERTCPDSSGASISRSVRVGGRAVRWSSLMTEPFDRHSSTTAFANGASRTRGKAGESLRPGQPAAAPVYPVVLRSTLQRHCRASRPNHRSCRRMGARCGRVRPGFA